MAIFGFGKTTTHESPRPAAPAPPVLQTGPRGNFVPMEDLLRMVVDENASDLHLSVGSPPCMRIHGRLVKLETRALFPEDVEKLVSGVASPEQMQRMRAEGSVDFAFTFGERDRFRASLYSQKGTMALALRLIPRRMLSLDEIGLPPAVHELLRLPRGLILVTGPTGSGKTTTLAAMLDEINGSGTAHIITIEDPIEYIHEHKGGMIHQRELGSDVPSFADGLRRALRQDPDVILVGEMRDLETMETAITAAETGHLVFSTLHTTGAGRTVDRVVDGFPAHQQEQVRTQLSMNLKAVISQLLLPRIDRPGRIAVFEVMINTHSIGALIRDNKSFRIASEIQTGAKYGMVSLEASLVDLYLAGVIAREDVFNKSQDPEMAAQLLAGREVRR
ncbi:MAG: type IV pilus twitching motility protein PilT [Chthoniobacteraceae bacterium]